MKIYYYLVLCLLASANAYGSTDSILKYVDPMIGTAGAGHTFPGATTPFGMVQLSPDQQLQGWEYCAGYQYSDSTIMGFSHTHLSGSGWSDLGDILMMPTVGEVQLMPGDPGDPDAGYRSRFYHKTETASPGYYSVVLDDYKVKAELTVTERVGFHRYTFPKSDKANIIIDPVNKIFGKTTETMVEFVSDRELRGYCKSFGWGGNRVLCFSAVFSKPFAQHGVYSNGQAKKGESAVGEDAKAWVRYSTANNEQIEVKVAISPVSIEGAVLNYNAEARNINFSQALKTTRAKWASELSRIDVRKASEETKTILYTGLYHSFLHPNLYMDADGKYVSSGKTHTAAGFTNYTTFSLWDTFRAVHPLFNIIQRKRNADMMNSLIARHKEGGHMPMWELCGFDNNCMIGYHSASVLWEAINKGIEGVDHGDALAAMVDASVANQPLSLWSSDGAPDTHTYTTYGYVPAVSQRSVSKTLEYTYSDYCISELAKRTGNPQIAETYGERAQGYQLLYNDEARAFLPKYQPWAWVSVNTKSWDDLRKHYVSGNIWAYNFFVPHDIEDLMRLRGGKERFERDLDEMFGSDLSMDGEQHVDISGFVGQYGHGDEPGHHIPYLYNYAGNHDKTCEIVTRIKREMYGTGAKGLVNNDDVGQMSSWYIFSALGFYPVNPSDNKYDLGTPSVEEAVINLENGNKFVIKAYNLSDQNIYVDKVVLNNSVLDRLFITHDEIMNGGTLEFHMRE